MKKYIDLIIVTFDFDKLNEIIESASFDDDLTNEEYEQIYVWALEKAKTL